MVSPAINQLMPLLYISCKMGILLAGTERALLLQRQGKRGWVSYSQQKAIVSHTLLQIFSIWVLLGNKAYCDLNIDGNASHQVGIRAVFSEVHEAQPQKEVRSVQPRSREVWGSSQCRSPGLLNSDTSSSQGQRGSIDGFSWGHSMVPQMLAAGRM